MINRCTAAAQFFRVYTVHQTVLASNGDGALITVAPKNIPGGATLISAFLPHPESRVCFLLAPSSASDITLSARLHRGFGPIFPVRLVRTGSEIVSFYAHETGLFLTMAPLNVALDYGGLAFVAKTPKSFEQLRLIPYDGDDLSDQMLRSAKLLERLCTPHPSPEHLARAFLDSALDQGSVNALNSLAALMNDAEHDQCAQVLVALPPQAIINLKRIFEGELSADYAIPEVSLWLRDRPNSCSRLETATDSAVQNTTSLAAVASDQSPAATLSSSGQAGRVLSRFAKYMRSTFSITKSSREISTTLALARSGHIREIGPQLDSLDGEGLDKRFVSLPFELNLALRRSSRPSRRACIVASARNEGLYLLEWVAYHKSVGFDHLFIYSNDNSDGSDDLLRALAEAGEITWINNIVGSGKRAQAKAFGHALRVMADTLDYEWCLCIDLDEFFVPRPEIFRTVHEFLEWHEVRPVDAVAINWRMIGSNGETHWRDELMLRRFPFVVGGANPHIKTIFRTKKFIHSYPHDPEERGRPIVYRNAEGDLHQFDIKRSRGVATNPSISTASIAHFFFKSNQELIWKGSRNRGGQGTSEPFSLSGLSAGFIREFARVSGIEKSLSGLEIYADVTQEGVTRLLVNSATRTAAENVKQRFRDQINELVERARQHPAVTDAGEAGSEFMRPLEANPVSRTL